MASIKHVPLTSRHPSWCDQPRCQTTISETTHVGPVHRWHCDTAAFALHLRRGVEHDFPSEASTWAVFHARSTDSDYGPAVEIWFAATEARVVARQLLAFADLCELNTPAYDEDDEQDGEHRV